MVEEIYPSDVEVEYGSMIRRNRIRIIVLTILALAAAIFSLFVSQIDSMTASHVIMVLKSHLFGGETAEKVYDLVVWEYNVPRAVLGVIVGASLAMGGAVMQSIMRNPLATPYTTGVSAGEIPVLSGQTSGITSAGWSYISAVWTATTEKCLCIW